MAASDVYTKVLPKTTEICDGLSNHWFSVTLMKDPLAIASDLLSEKYRVEVSSFKQSSTPIVVASRPCSGEVDITSYDIADEVYNEYVISYSSIVKAVTRDIQNIEIYQDKINYAKTQPKCCATCEYCEKTATQKDYVFGVSEQLECHNPNNITRFDFNRNSNSNLHPICNTCTPPQPAFIHPQVDPLGVCENYKYRQRSWIPTPGDSVSKIIDERIEYEFNNNLSNNTALSVMISAMIDNNISSIVISEISGGNSVDETVYVSPGA